MGKTLLGTLLLALMLAVPMTTKAEVFVDINIGLPPLIEFAAPPELIVLPGTYVYVAPDVDQDIYFYGGWWWRPWEGHWYRSRHYDSGWTTYRSVPRFYRGIPSGWRDDYRGHQWQGRQWDYQRLPHQQVHRNWKSWEKNKHWQKQQGWGVKGLQSQPRTQPAQRAVQPRQSRSQLKKAQPAQVQQRHQRPQAQKSGNRSRGQAVQQQQRSHAQQPAQKMQSRQSRPQAHGAKAVQSPKQGGKQAGGQEEHQGRR